MRSLIQSYLTPASRRAAANLVGLTACAGASHLAGVGLLVLLANGLGPDGYGALAVAQHAQAVMLVVSTLGLGLVTVRDLNRMPERADETIGGFLGVTAGAAAAVGLGVAAAAAVLTAGGERTLLVLAAGGNLFAALNLSPVFDARHRQAWGAALQVPADVAVVAAAAGLAAAGRLTLPAAGVLLVLRPAGQLAAQAVALARSGLRPCWNRGRAGAMVRAGLPVLAAGLLNLIPSSGSVLLLRFGGGEPADVARFALAQQLALVFVVLFSLVVRVALPYMAGPGGTGRAFVGRLAVAVGGFLVTVNAVGILAVRLLFDRVFDSEYEPAFGLFLVLLAAASAYCVAVVLCNYLLILGRERLVPVAHLAAAAGYAAVLFGGDWSPERFAAAAGAFATALAATSSAAVWKVWTWPVERSAEVSSR